MEKDKELDDLFKRGFDDPEHQPDFREGDWDALESMLDGNKKRAGIVRWLPVMTAVAAMLLIAFGLWMFMHKAPEKQQAAVNRISPKNTSGTIQKKSGTVNGSAQQNEGNYASAVNATAPANHNNSSSTATPATLAVSKKSRPAIITSDDGARRDATGAEEQAVVATASDRQFLASATTVSLSGIPVNVDDTIAPANFMPKDNYGVIAANKVKAKAITSAYKPQFAITVLGSSDMNGLNSFSQSKVGTNVGVLFSAGIFKRLTISTGAIYSSKPYITNAANYHGGYTFPSTPTTVNADCRMIDVPLNLDYNLYNKHRNKFSVGTGISSYLMFHEAYNYTYGYYGSGPSTYNVPNPGKYYLSILNLQATYQRQINSKLGLDVQPYMKLPLSGVGLYNSKLQSTGIAVGLTWSLGKH
jgi:cytoskeletal protein RodZ